MTQPAAALPLPSVLPLSAALDRSLAGAKAATLGALRERGHRVPDGFVVPAGADVGSEAWRQATARGLASLGEGAVAVRSSALAEDGAEVSFAGQLLTLLDVRGADDVIDAVARCVRSGDGGEIDAYRAAVAPGAERGVAVLVQHMVAAEIAGVAFGVNPATGDDEVLVSAVRGLGDRLVSGEVSGETWVVSDRPRPAEPASVLTEALAARIAALTRRLGDELGGPQDVEWALAGGELFVLQSRPVTAAPVRPDFDDDPTQGTWFRDEVHVPSTVTAFASDTYMPRVMRGMSAMAAEVGLLIDGIEFFWRGGDWYGRVVPPGGKEGPAPPRWALWLASRVLPAMRARSRAARRVLESGALEALLTEWTSGGRERFEAEVRGLAAVDRAALGDEALLAHVDEILALMQRGQEIHFRLFMPWVMHTHRLVTVARELLGWEERKTLELLAGWSATSNAPARELVALGRRLRERGDPSAVVAADQPVEALRRLDPTLADEAERWMERWGLRAIGYDPGSPTLSEQPGLLLELLRQGLAGEEAPEVSSDALLGEAHAALADPARRRRFDDALAEARRVFPAREDNVLYTDNLVNGLARRAAMAIGARLHARGQLQRPEDVVELRHAEQREALLGTRADTATLARRRRLERAWVAAHPGPSLLRGTQEPPPDATALPGPLRAFNEPFLWVMGLEYPPPRDPFAEGEGLTGVGAWPGRYTGTARVVRDERDLGRVRRGDVLVAKVTTPAWSVVFPRIGALVTDGGGLLSHAAIVAREHGVPTVLATGSATTRLRDGDRVVVDGGRGRVELAP